ncbi:hypothetical protein [Pseudomonas alkylphenolica]|uniref:Uncharacterized protein n=1 Tax=Pseudomonas alkylphenolica TaxID=237609 RepID=A0A077F686_9PSED|nr:hypothetical protein [Pseudomonas alkylphenolica]AIL61017.1 hypothetical protein PSAKL28_17930 [Pseudomonas alkylphenolica]
MELQRAGLLRFSLIVGASLAGDARHSRASANLHQPYRPILPPVRWKESTAIWATRFIVVSEEQQALTLHLPIHNCEQTSSFALAFTIAYQLEAERDVFHHTTFVLRDLYITRSYGVTIMTEGTYRLDSVEDMPPGTGKAPFKLFIKDDLATADV